MVDLLKLVGKFQAKNDRESNTAFFRTHVPWVAPEAYLNTIFKPAAPEALSEVNNRLRMPDPILELLKQHNGAILLSRSLSLFGVVGKGQLYNRSDPFSLPPYNIETENLSGIPDRDRFLKVGGYRYDGSGAYIDRQTLEIVLFREGEKKPCCSWPTLDDWLNTEIRRLTGLFDASGKRLVDEAQTLPPVLAQYKA